MIYQGTHPIFSYRSHLALLLLFSGIILSISPVKGLAQQTPRRGPLETQVGGSVSNTQPKDATAVKGTVKGNHVQGGEKQVTASFSTSVSDYQHSLSWSDTDPGCFISLDFYELKVWYTIQGSSEVLLLDYSSGSNYVSSYTPSLNLGPGVTSTWRANRRYRCTAGSTNDDNYGPSTKTTLAMKPPTNVQASDNVSDSKVTITWSKGTDHPDANHSYWIYRNGNFFASTSGSSRSYVANVTPNQSDTWGVLSRSHFGVSNPNSTLATNAGSTLTFRNPTNVDATDDTHVGFVRVTWTNKSDYATHFRIYRDGVLIATVVRTADIDQEQSYDDLSIQDGVIHNYCVRSYHQGTNTESTATTGNPFSCDNGRGYPLYPEASDGTLTNRVKISWRNIAALADNVKIYRDGDEIGMVPSNANVFYDYDALPGKLSKYGITPIKNSVEFVPIPEYGFIPANGRIEGKITTQTLAGVKDVDVSITPVTDTLDYSLFFDGVDDVVDAMKNYQDVTNSFTMELWVKPASIRTSTTQSTTGTSGTSGQRYAIAPRNDQAEFGSGHSSAGISVGTNGISVFEHANSYLPSLLVHDTTIPSNAWTHVAVVYDGNQPRLYINGIWRKTGAVSTRIVHPSALFGDVQGYGPYHGLLDDVRIWDHARSDSAIREDMYRTLRGNEIGLVGYWPLARNTRDTGIVKDDAIGYGRHGRKRGPIYSKDIPGTRYRVKSSVDGHYVLRNINYDESTEFEITPFRERHGFKPDTRKRTLDIPNPTALAVEFIDTTAFGVEGYIYFTSMPGQVGGCPVAGVRILVNGMFQGTITDSTGRFALSVPEEGLYTFTPEYRDHTFSPSSITRFITDHIDGPNALQFTDTRTRQLALRARGGSLKCDVAIGIADVTIHALGTKDNGLTPCYSYTTATTIDGNLYLTVPAQRYKLIVNHRYAGFGSPGKEEQRTIDYRSERHVVSIDSTVVPPDTTWQSTSDTLRFQYHSEPVLTMDQFWEDICGLKVTDQGVAYRVYMQAVEQYTDINNNFVECPLDTGYVFIFNDIQDGFTGLPDTVQISDGQIYVDHLTKYYSFTAGEPNIYENGVNPNLSYLKNFHAMLKAYDHPFVQSPQIWALVRGHKARTQSFITKTPPLPFLILRDPPGDQSSSSIEKSRTVTQSYTLSIEHEGGAGLYFETKVGAGTTLPFVGKTGVDFHIQAKLGAGGSRVAKNTVTTSWVALETISTADEVPGVSRGANGDVIMGAGLNLLYAKTDVVDLNETTCTIIRDTSLAWGTEGFHTTYIYTVDHIKNTLIPQLQWIAQKLYSSGRPLAMDSAAIIYNEIAVWNQVLRTNDSLKTVAQKKSNISFSAGAPYTSSHTTTTDSTTSYDFSAYINAELAVGIGAHAGDFNMVEGGVEANFKWTRAETFDTTISTSTTISFTLSDDDPGDFFTVDVLEDPVYKTPVFKTIAGRSSCPWEPGTQSRDGAVFPGSEYPKPLIQADKYLQTEIPPNDPATFILTLTNTSESDEARYYDLYVDQASNLDGAIVRVGGVVIEEKLTYYLPPGMSRKATMTIERGPVAYDYNDIQIVLTPSCDYWLEDRKSFSVQFLNPCSKATIVEPVNNWLVNQTSNNILHLVLTDLEKDKIGPDLELQYRKIGTQKWELGMIIPKNDIVDQKFKFFETDWVIPSSLADGTYELRVKIQCTSALGGGITYSNTVTGIINRNDFQVFGTPEPRDGILNFGDEISVTFSGDIDCGAIGQAGISLMYTDNNQQIPRDSILIDCRDNKLILKPLVPVSQMQNRQMVATVADVFNQHGNKLLNPIVWSFKVNQNTLIWETSNTSATVYQGSKVNLTGKLKNVGGMMETFLLSNTKGWLTPFTTSGTIPPSGVQTIIFSVSDKLNPGVYRDTVYAMTSHGDEPYYIEVTVLYEPPRWTVNPNKYQHNMPITAQWMLDTTLSTDVNDIIAAFVGNECRGVANIQYVPSVNVFRAFLTVYSEARNAETVSFKVWDASSGKIYSMMETFAFDQNASHGSLLNPVVLHPAGIIQTFPLDQGWTWFSLNTTSPNMSPNAVLAATTASAGDVLKGQTTYAQYVNGTGWVGNLTQLQPGVAYKLSLANAATLQFTGNLVPPTTPINLVPGWNWIGYLPIKNLDVNTALSSLTPSVNDKLKSRNDFAEYHSTGQWQGSLTTMTPNQGYLLRTASSGTLTYPNVGNFSPNRNQWLFSKSFMLDDTADWTVNPSMFEHTMNVTGVLQVDGALSNDGGDIIAAFVADQCRGVARPIEVNGQQTFFVTVYSNADETIRFKAYHAKSDSILTVNEQLAFVADEVLGRPDEPFIFRASTVTVDVESLPGIPNEYTLEQNYPNPFNPSTTIAFSIPRAGHVSIKLYDLLGKEIATLVNRYLEAGNHQIRFLADGLQSGLYSYRMTAEGFAQSRQMMLVK